MLAWKSNVEVVSIERITPTFRAVAWVNCPNSQRMAFVKLDRDREDLNQFQNSEVVIDGGKYRCIRARTYAPGPYRRGDSIGILVADVQPSGSSSN